MFNFTTTTVFNTADSFSAVSGKLTVKGIGTFKKNEAVFKKTAGAAGVAPVLTATPTGNADATTAGLYRLTLSIKLVDSMETSFNNSLSDSTKVSYFEFNVANGDTVADISENIADLVNFNRFGPQSLVVATHTANKATITGANPYLVFNNYVIEKYNTTTDIWAASSYITLGYTPSSRGLGTYEFLIKNIVLPTSENLRFSAPVGDMPIKGATYTQYVFTLTKPRVGIGSSVVGEKNTSITKHVCYVLSGAVTTTVDGLITTSTIDAEV